MQATRLHSANALQTEGEYFVTVPKKILVVGGSAAGPKAAAKARRMDEQAEITIIQKEPQLSMASCGYPYYVGGFFDDRNQLLCTPTGVVRDPNFFKGAKKIEALTCSEAVHIDRKAKTVTYKDLETGIHYDRAYDKLVLATGAIPKCPAVPGVTWRASPPCSPWKMPTSCAPSAMKRPATGPSSSAAD